MLFTKGINYKVPECVFKNDLLEIFPVQEEGFYSFDIFSAIFFMLSRIEEYSTENKDNLGRFDFKNFFAVKNNFHSIPVVDKWCYKLVNELKKSYPNIPIKIRQFQFIPTIDIDNAFAYQNKGLYRQIGGFAKSIIKSDFQDINQRIKVLSGKEQDPYFTFNEIENLCSKYKISPIFFFLVAKYGKYDKNVNVSNPSFRKLIKNISEKYEIGIHPSYQSNSNHEIIENEITVLKNITGKEITKSRQHFLMLNFPKTYQTLINNGISEDYTLGFAHDTGFRAGTCTPFTFFDVIENKSTNLRLFPFQIMDTTLREYLKLNINEAQNKVEKIITEIKSVDGTFVSLSHNESFSPKNAELGWRDLFEYIIKRCI